MDQRGRPPGDLSALLTRGEEFAHTGSFEVTLPTWTWQASPGLYRILGRDPGEQTGDEADVGSLLLSCLHPGDVELVRRQMTEALAEAGAFRRSVRIVRPDGSIRNLRVAGHVEADAEGRAARVTGMAQDITDEVEVLRAWQSVERGSQELVRAKDEPALLQRMCEVLVEEGGYRLVWYARINPGHEPLITCAARAGHDDGYIDGHVLNREHGIVSQDPSTSAIVSGEPVVVGDMGIDERFAPWREFALARGYRSLAVLPVRVDDAVDGALLVYSENAYSFAGQLHPLLTTLAADIGYGIGRLRDGARLEASLLASVDLMGAVLEVRDPYTAGHQVRVAQLATTIGQTMGLTELQLQGLALGGAIHDLGKLAVPSDLLAKPGTLLPEEMALIRTHATRGYELARRFDWPWPIATMMHQHHERYDGSGYPLGLAAQQICIEARILGVADTYEAVCHHRPYRPAMGPEEAQRIVLGGAGTKFDPAVVEAFSAAAKAGFTFSDDPWSASTPPPIIAGG